MTVTMAMWDMYIWIANLKAQPIIFSPNVTMDRWIIVTGYATSYIAWPADHDIIRGFTPGTFAPGETLSHEQIVEILYRYAVYKGKVPS